MAELNRTLSLAFRVTLLFSVATAAVFSVFGWMVYDSTKQRFVDEDSAELVIVASAVEEMLREFSETRDTKSLEQRLADTLVGHHNVSMLLVGPRGEPIYSSQDLDLTAALRSKGIGDELSQQQFEWRRHRVLMRVIQVRDFDENYQVTVAVPISQQIRFLKDFRLNLAVMIVVGIVLMGLLGLIAVRRGHAPLHTIVERISRISADKLGSRIDEAEVPRELADLVASFNEMLGRVDHAFHQLQGFNADIAHELRTPIANLMTQTQVSLSKSRPAVEYRETLYSNAEEFERMSQMVSDMLFLAKADTDQKPLNVERVDLATEIDSLIDYYVGWASDHHIELNRVGSADVKVDRQLMRRAVGNLVSNAIKNSRDGSEVTVKIQMPSHGLVTITIQNSGDKIPEDEWEHIFERFYRLPDRRESGHKGVGLGLSIAMSIIKAHGGNIVVHSDENSTRFIVSIPVESS